MSPATDGAPADSGDPLGEGCSHSSGGAPAGDAHTHADSAGVPWEGRAFQANPHAADDGSADPDLLAALVDFHAGVGDQTTVIDAYRNARLLIPLVAEKGDEGVGPHGLAVDKTQELSIVTVAAPDGRKVLPVFTSVQTMQRWDAAARPIPTPGLRTALAASAEDTDLIVVDPASDTEFVIRRPAVWAIAQGIPWEPAVLSAEVFSGLQESIGAELAVLDLSVEAGDPSARLRGPEIIVRLHLVDGLDKEQLDAVLARLAKRWAADDRIAVLVDSLSVKLVRGL